MPVQRLSCAPLKVRTYFRDGNEPLQVGRPVWRAGRGVEAGASDFGQQILTAVRVQLERIEVQRPVLAQLRSRGCASRSSGRTRNGSLFDATLSVESMLCAISESRAHFSIIWRWRAPPCIPWTRTQARWPSGAPRTPRRESSLPCPAPRATERRCCRAHNAGRPMRASRCRARRSERRLLACQAVSVAYVVQASADALARCFASLCSMAASRSSSILELLGRADDDRDLLGVA